MKKHIAFCMLATLLTFSLLTGCAQKPTGDGSDEQASTKPVISFEGVVTDVTDGVVTLENGQKIQITEDTAFGDLDAQDAVSSDIRPGNYIQGYTTDDADAEQVTAGNIWTNEAAPEDEETLSKPVINFEGRVAAVKDGTVVLEDGKEIRITADTVFGGDPDTQNEVSSDIQPGNYIQGYSSDALDDAQRTASHIWTNMPAE